MAPRDWTWMFLLTVEDIGAELTLHVTDGYSEFLAEKLLNLFPPKEAFAFFEANETARPVVLRTNTLRTHRRDLAQALINRESALSFFIFLSLRIHITMQSIQKLVANVHRYRWCSARASGQMVQGWVTGIRVTVSRHSWRHLLNALLIP